MNTGPLKGKSEKEQIAYLLLWIGDKGRDIHSTWTDISEEDVDKIQTYYDRFRAFVQPKLNPIFLDISSTIKYRAMIPLTHI